MMILRNEKLSPDELLRIAGEATHRVAALEKQVGELKERLHGAITHLQLWVDRLERGK